MVLLIRPYLLPILASLASLATLSPPASAGGGGGVLTDDRCLVEIGFAQIHLTMYQPNSRGNEQFCRALPDSGPSIVVLDYLHDALRTMPIEATVLRDSTGLGRTPSSAAVMAIKTFEQDRVFHQPPVHKVDGSLVLEPDFDAPGAYILLLSATHPDSGNVYRSAVALQVGDPGTGYWPVLLLIAGLFAGYLWVSNGGLQRLRSKHEAKRVAQS